MSQAIDIRPASPKDRTFIQQLVPRFLEPGAPNGRDESQIIHAILNEMSQFWRSGNGAEGFFIAEDLSGKPLGFILLTSEIDFFTQEKHGHIADLAVVSTAEGQGIGQALMQFAETWAKSQNYPFLTLNAFPQNQRGRSFYTQLGYQEDLIKYLKRLN
jgi:GNAT superfamily N-acetyltransferase